MKKLYFALFFLVISCLQLMFDSNIDQVTLLWRNYKVSIQSSFLIFFLIVIFLIINEIYKISSYIISTISNVRNFWERQQQKDLINNLFLTLYYIDIEDKNSLEKVFKKIESVQCKAKIVPPALVNLIKYFAARYLNRDDLLEQFSNNLLQDKATSISGIKALIEYKLKKNDMIGAENLLINAKKATKLLWIKEYEIEIEKNLGNFDKAADSLIALHKQDVHYNLQTKFTEIENLLLNQSKSFQEKGNVPAAKKCIKRLLALNPLNFEAQILLINTYISTGNIWYANYLIKKAWKNTPSKALLDKFPADNHKYDGLKLLKKKEELLKINSSLNAIIAFVKVFIEHNQFNKAREYLEKISVKQKSPEFYKLLSEIELKTGGDPLVISQLLEKI